MMADSLEQQLPFDAVEEAFDVQIEHPIITPAPLTRCTHGIECRSAGPVAIGIGVKYRLQMWLQEATGDFLRDAIRYRRDAQRARAAVRFRNFHSPHRRRKYADRPAIRIQLPSYSGIDRLGHYRAATKFVPYPYS